MNIALYLSAFTLGFLGSFHCAGMCGPIAMVLPTGYEKKRIIWGRLLYNIGRIVTYMLLGLVAGFMGYAMAINGFQRELSILTGITIIVAVFLSRYSTHLPTVTGIIARFTSPIKQELRKLFGKGSLLSLFFIGVLNGLLPCGFVYIALAGSVAAGHYTDGMIYMFLFGAGTLPMMLTLSLVGNFISIKARRTIRKISPVIAILLALFLIHRGSGAASKNCCNDRIEITSVR